MFYLLLQHYKSPPKIYFLTSYAIVPSPNINPEGSWNHFGSIVISNLPVWKLYTHLSGNTPDLYYSHNRPVTDKAIRRSLSTLSIYQKAPPADSFNIPSTDSLSYQKSYETASCDCKRPGSVPSIATCS